MIITLNYDEVLEALVKALDEKTKHVLGEFNPNDGYFTVTTENGEVEGVEQVKFTMEA